MRGEPRPALAHGWPRVAPVATVPPQQEGTSRPGLLETLQGELAAWSASLNACQRGVHRERRLRQLLRCVESEPLERIVEWAEADREASRLAAQLDERQARRAALVDTVRDPEVAIQKAHRTREKASLATVRADTLTRVRAGSRWLRVFGRAPAGGERFRRVVASSLRYLRGWACTALSATRRAIRSRNHRRGQPVQPGSGLAAGLPCEAGSRCGRSIPAAADRSARGSPARENRVPATARSQRGRRRSAAIPWLQCAGYSELGIIDIPTTCMSSAAPLKNCPSPNWINRVSATRTRYSATTGIPHCGATSGHGLKVPTSALPHPAIRNAPQPSGQQRNPDAVGLLNPKNHLFR